MGDMRQAIEGALDYKIRVETQITQLKADLAKYAGHTAECKSRDIDVMEDEPRYWKNFPCDCGYEKAKKGWE